MAKNNFHILTYGCQMNVRDSHWLETYLENSGYLASSLADAQIIIINTCSVREKPEKKTESILQQIAGVTRKNPEIIICVTGCVAQQLGEKIFALSPQVRLIAGTDAISDLPASLDLLLADPMLKINDIRFKAFYPERKKLRESWPHGSAYVNIMQGCDNFCAYCIVPYTRGRQKSRLKAEILTECQEALKAGASEITLLGQNVNAWGKDNAAGHFVGLLEEVSALEGLKRLHFVTPHPADMKKDTIHAFAELKNLAPRLHLPLQAGSDRILAKMGRRYDRNSFLKLVEELRKTREDLALSTDIIVGFPGESEADFKDTLDMLEKCSFMSSFSFCYSDRPGTRASKMENKIDPAIKQERLLRLQEAQDKLTATWLKERIGEETEILLEMPSAKANKDLCQWQGRDPYGAVVNIELPNAIAGEYIKVLITDAAKHSLKAKVL